MSEETERLDVEVRELRSELTQLRIDYEAHDSWVKRAWKTQDIRNEATEKEFNGPGGVWEEVNELKIVTAIAKVRLSMIIILSNAIGGGITLAIFWLARIQKG